MRDAAEAARTEVTDEPVPCGTCRTTRYFDAAGTVIRQDIEILVDPDKVPGLSGIVGG